MVASYVSPAVLAGVTRNMERLHATKVAMAGGEIDVVFARWNPQAENWVAIYPQHVLVTYADRQEREVRDDAGELVTVDGYLKAFAPFDVERKDLFSLGDTGDEERGEIVRVYRAKFGTQRAAFRLRLGEQ